jgi:hypothetical protein
VSGHLAGVAGTYNKALYLDERRRALGLWEDRVAAFPSPSYVRHNRSGTLRSAAREARVTKSTRLCYWAKCIRRQPGLLQNGKIVLTLSFRNRKSEPRATPMQLPVARSLPFPQLADPTTTPNTCSKLVCRKAVPKSRRKPVQIARLYPQRPPEPLRQARALIDLIREECPEITGLYVPKSDLERTYRELCAAQSWKTYHWTSIARQLRALTKNLPITWAGRF